MIKGNERRITAVCVYVALFLAAVGAAGCGGGHATAEPAAGTWTPVATPAATSAPATATEVTAATATAGPAASPTVGPGGTASAQTEFPYRVTLTGPAAAHPGDVIAYDLAYQCIQPDQGCTRSTPIAFDGFVRGVAFVASTPPAADTSQSPPPLGYMKVVDISGASGEVHLTVSVAATFSGPMAVGVVNDVLQGYGQSRYYWPDQSVVEVTTNVVPASTP